MKELRQNPVMVNLSLWTSPKFRKTKITKNPVALPTATFLTLCDTCMSLLGLALVILKRQETNEALVLVYRWQQSHDTCLMIVSLYDMAFNEPLSSELPKKGRIFFQTTEITSGSQFRSKGANPISQNTIQPFWIHLGP